MYTLSCIEYLAVNIPMLKTWLLIAWVGTTSNFQILHESFTHEHCRQERQVWQQAVDAHVQLDCVQDLREGRSQYPPRWGSHGLVK
jgi:hypothetical protein